MSKYKKALIFYVLYIAFFITIFIIINPTLSTQDLSPYAPGIGFIEKVLLFIVFWTAGSIIGAVVFGYLLGPFFLYVQKNTIGRNMVYGIQENIEPDKFRWFWKALFPSLMAVNFAIIVALNPSIANQIT